MKEFNSEAEELAWFVGLVEGEGSFNVYTNSGRWQRSRFEINMTDRDVIDRAANLLSSWGIIINKILVKNNKGRDGRVTSIAYSIQVGKSSDVKVIIDKTYQYYSEKKQSDCDRVLKNLADRGLL